MRTAIGAMIYNKEGLILAANRSDQPNALQMPQGGQEPHEKPLECLYRELYEELALEEKDLEITGVSKETYSYILPSQVHNPYHNKYVGQSLRWFLLYLKGPDSSIRLDLSETPEFISWQWICPTSLIDKIVWF